MAMVTVGSIQTLCREKRMEALPDFTHIIVDEAHRVLSDQYQTLLQRKSNAKVLGVTATPDRGDKRNLGQFFQKVSFEYDIRDAITAGYLCKIKAKTIPLKIDLSSVSTIAGDFSDKDLCNAIDPYLEQMAQHIDYSRKTLIFLPLVETSKKMSNIINSLGKCKCEHIDGSSDDRSDILKRFERGETTVLCNSMLLTEGYDCPSISQILIARPTKSRALFTQMVGRGTRPSSGKDHLLIIDPLWQSTKHDLCKPVNLFAKTKQVADRMQEKIDDPIGGGDVEQDLLDLENIAEKDEQNARERSLIEQLKQNKHKRGVTVDPVWMAVTLNDHDIADYEAETMWDMAPASDKQLTTLESFGIPKTSVMNRGHASMLIGKMFQRSKLKLATMKQVKLLQSFGINATMMAIEDAKNKIDQCLTRRRQYVKR